MRWQDFNVELSERRFELGRSIGEVANDLGISRDVLIALENGDYERMPQNWEARNALATYAGYLGLDVQEILDAYEQGRNAYINGNRTDDWQPAEVVEAPRENPRKSDAKSAKSAGSRTSRKRRPPRRAFAFVAVVVVLLVVLVIAGVS